MDLVSLSFWFSQNAVLNADNRRKVFVTNSVLNRLILIADSLDVRQALRLKRYRLNSV